MRDRFLGAFLGGGIGDALGSPITGLSKKEIVRVFGDDGVSGFVPEGIPDGVVGDETQVMLFTAEGLLRAWAGKRFGGAGGLSGLFGSQPRYGAGVSRSLLGWLSTQNDLSGASLAYGKAGVSWLFERPELHVRRDPDQETLASLDRLAGNAGGESFSGDGSGVVVRAVPAGLFLSRAGKTPKEVFAAAGELARMTHHEPAGYLSAAAMAAIVGLAVRGASIEEAVYGVRPILAAAKGAGEVLESLEYAEELARSLMSVDYAFRQFGTATRGNDALAAAVYSALVADDFREGVLIAVNSDGRSDVVGSLTGCLIGAEVGLDGIPEEWASAIDLLDPLVAIACDLYDCVDWKSADREEAVRKYPPV